MNSEQCDCITNPARQIQQIAAEPKNNTAGYWETDEVKSPHNRSLVNVAHFHRAGIPTESAALVLELRVSSNTPALLIPDVNHRLGVPRQLPSASLKD